MRKTRGNTDAGKALCFSQMRKTHNTVCQLRGDCYLLPVNGPTSLIVSGSPSWSSVSWFLMYSAIRLAFFPAVSTEYPLLQNSLLRYLYFHSPNCSYSIVLLLPFWYPMKLETDSFGGISYSIWTWSGHASASTIFTPFHSRNCRNTFPTASRFSP